MRGRTVLSHEGIGGVRQASFERGLVFIETVTSWEPERKLGFDIQVDPDHTPLTTRSTRTAGISM